MRSTILAGKRARTMRRSLTLPEGLLWRALRRNSLGPRFRRQHPIGPYILDFYCAAARLAVEVDGSGHEHPERIAHDERRDAWLRARGVRVMRVAAAAVLDDFGLEVLLAQTAEACSSSPAERGRGTGPRVSPAASPRTGSAGGGGGDIQDL